MKTDVLVIGGGLAGSMAALAAAEAGRRVTLVSAGEATLHMESGCIDLWGAGSLGSAAGSPDGAATAPGKAIARLDGARPDHPYSLAGRDALEGGLAAFLAYTEEAGYPYQGGLGRNRLVPTAIGSLKPTGLVPPTMAAGDAVNLISLLVVGFEELKDSYPTLAAENLSAALGIPVRAASVALGYRGFRELTPVQVANLLGDPEQRRVLMAKVAQVHRGEATVALPPVLGLDPSPAILEEFRRGLRAEVFEMPALSPSVPGMRLAQVLYDRLRAARVRLVKAEAMEGLRRSSRATGVRLRSLAGDGEVEFRALVLATGGLAGGAYELASGNHQSEGGALRERLFQLPVQVSPHPDDWARPEWLDARGQPLGSAGVATDRLLRPLSSGGAAELENVFLAGRILAGHDPIMEKCGNGVAIATGRQAGRLAAEVSGT